LALCVVTSFDELIDGTILNPLVANANDFFALRNGGVQVVDVSLRNSHIPIPFLVIEVCAMLIFLTCV